VIGLGLDVCAVARIEAAILANDGFLLRYYTAGERAYLEARGKMAAQSAAAMFAAKEAFLKALGVGLGGGVYMAEIGVIHDALGCPGYLLTGKALDSMAAKGAREARLSLSHDAGVAAAVCVLE
jgi:holo-[acyl-carrier protein] synthase